MNFDVVAENIFRALFGREPDEYRNKWELFAIKAALRASVVGANVGAERVRHKKRGTTYEVIGEAEVQISIGDVFDGTRVVCEGDRLTVYRGAGGKLWVRPSDEFNDGRFEAVGTDVGTGEISPANSADTSMV